MGNYLALKRSVVLSVSHAQLFTTPWAIWTVAHQAPPATAFSKQEYWRLSSPSPGIKKKSAIKS